MNTNIFANLIFLPFLLACNQIVESPQLAITQQPIHSVTQLIGQGINPNMILKSTDGGQTWNDISAGLPEIKGMELFVNGNELYLSTGDGMYLNKSYSSNPEWQKESMIVNNCNIVEGRACLFAYDFYGHFLQKLNGMHTWFPVFTNFEEKNIRTVFETSNGTVFIGCDNGLFRSTDHGKTWKQVQNQGWTMKMVESNGVIMATSQQGIIRSTNDGELWDLVINEGGVGIAIEQIDGGFAAITYNTKSKTRRIRTSYDGGKTWLPIDVNLHGHDSTASIKQMGKYFFCGHPEGIFRSADKGKSWQMLLPSIDKKVFNLTVAGNVIYAIPRAAGC